MFLDKKQRRSCLLGFAIFLALLPVFALVLLSEYLAKLALHRTGKAENRRGGPDDWPRCTDLRRPVVNTATWRLKVGGQVANPSSFSAEDLMAMPRRRRGLPMTCTKGWVYNATWIGAQFSEIVRRVKPSAAARWVEFIGADGYHECSSLQKLLSREAFLADWLNTGPLPPNHGAPARLIFPTRYGYKNVKWLQEIIFRSDRAKGYLDGKLEGYTADGTIIVGRRWSPNTAPSAAPPTRR